MFPAFHRDKKFVLTLYPKSCQNDQHDCRHERHGLGETILRALETTAGILQRVYLFFYAVESPGWIKRSPRHVFLQSMHYA
jgi:hypothetical protein